VGERSGEGLQEVALEARATGPKIIIVVSAIEIRKVTMWIRTTLTEREETLL